VCFSSSKQVVNKKVSKDFIQKKRQLGIPLDTTTTNVVLMGFKTRERQG